MQFPVFFNSLKLQKFFNLVKVVSTKIYIEVNFQGSFMKSFVIWNYIITLAIFLQVFLVAFFKIFLFLLKIEREHQSN